VWCLKERIHLSREDCNQTQNHEQKDADIRGRFGVQNVFGIRVIGWSCGAMFSSSIWAKIVVHHCLREIGAAAAKRGSCSAST
jgi:hypothetical protein